MLFSTYKYAVDTCAFTHLRREYPTDVFPGVWNKLDELLNKQALCSVEEVYYEIMAKDDDLTDWAKANRHIFILPDERIQKEVLQILKTHSNLIDVRKDKSGADPFLIAAAMIHKCSVVTEEKPSGGPDRSKIPDVCNYYQVECIRALDMLRREGLKL
jgi:hypothetical protein